MKRMLVLALSGLLATALASCSREEAPAAAPPEVYVADVVQKDVPIYMEIVGQTRGSQDVEIRARVEGFLDRVAFTEGAFVRKGALLYQIDPQPLEAALAQARANLATNQARLDQTTVSVNRLKPLAEQQAVSQQELDNALSNQDAARAQVDAARAAADKAALDLGYARITSPIDGVVGTTLVKAGNLVGRGESTLLTTVSQIDPILFRAGISEAEYLRIARRADELRAARGGEEAVVHLLLADGTTHPYTGRIEAVERAVDPTTGTLAVQFTFPNPERLLRPGQYGRARFESEIMKGALLVPQRAVQELQDVYTVAVVGADSTVELRNVEVGPRVDSLWVVEKGLEPGETVVVEGLQRLRDGITVNAKPLPPPGPTGEAEPAAALGETS
jgi:membrane fusion protein (multidrug efflux system)